MHADLGSTMLTPLHAAGWCLVDFFKPADFLVIQGTRKKRGARLLGGVRLLGIIRYVQYDCHRPSTFRDLLQKQSARQNV